MKRYCKCKVPKIGLSTNGEIMQPFCERCRRPIKLKIRRTWKRKPQTQIKKSDKLYNRKKAKRKLKKRIREE